MSANSPPVQYAIIALAAQHKAYAEWRPTQTLAPESQDIYPLLNYGKAIRALNSRITDVSNSTRMVQESLVACLLFICLNILQGNDLGAMTHLSSGLQINVHLAKTICISEPGSSNGPIHQLIETFKRLDLQAALYLGSHQIKSVSLEVDHGSSISIPEYCEKPFRSPEEARQALMDIVLSAAHFMRLTAEPLKYLDLESTDARQRYALNLRDTYIQELHGWRRSLEIYMSSQPSEQQMVEREQILKCSISYAQTMTALSVCLAPDETEYDACFPLFLDILQNAEDILLLTAAPHSQKARLPNKITPPFDLEVSIVQPLYFTALKCRVSDARDRAIALMYRTGKEGVWDGALMARIAEHVVRLEESKRHTNMADGDTDIREESRVCGVAINVIRKQSKVSVQCITRAWISTTKNSAADSLAYVGHGKGDGYNWEFREDILQW
jgi:hypothetical protein